HLVGVATLLLAAVGRPGGKACFVLAADHLLLVVLERQEQEAGLLDGVAAPAAAAEAEHQVQRRLLLDVVVGQGAAILQLLPREDEALLVRRDTFLVLDLGLDVVDGVAALHLQRDRLPRQRLHEDLHL
ncbi:Os09g0483150, partial [Oryza sativa Japonica Group]